MRTELKIMIPIAVVVVVLGGYMVFKSGDIGAPAQVGQTVDQSKLVRTTSHMTGKADAKVTVVEFGDFECPSCADAYQPMNDIIKQYSSNPNFNFVFREFPLSSIHPNADISAEAAEAAGEQGKFWDMHDLLYKNQGEWASSSNPITLFVKYAQQLGLDTNKFQTEVQAAKFANVIKADGDDGNAANVTATPTFFVNGTPYLGIPSQDMKDAIAKAIAAAK